MLLLLIEIRIGNYLNHFHPPPPHFMITGMKLLLDRLEKAALSVGLAMNYSKTKFMAVNTPEEVTSMKSSSGNEPERVSDFIYLGA